MSLDWLERHIGRPVATTAWPVEGWTLAVETLRPRSQESAMITARKPKPYACNIDVPALRPLPVAAALAVGSIVIDQRSDPSSPAL